MANEDLTTNNTDDGVLVGELGISEDDRQDVRRQIDQIVSENRIAVNDAHFKLGGVKRGGGFPVIVNLVAGSILVIGVVVLSLVFKGNEQVLVGNSIEYSSIEGQLIRQLRQESTQRITEKDQQIKDIETKLGDLERERQKADDSVETRIAERRAEYENRILEQVSVRREQLTAQGVTTSEITRLLDEYGKELRRQYDVQLEAYRKTVEQERSETLANIDRLRSEYISQINGLKTERQTLMEDFRSQEADLRSRLEQQTTVLEQARSDAISNLASARAELTRLQMASERSESVENQVMGFYDRIRAALSRSAWQEAITSIDQAASYLNQDAVRASSSVTSRRTSDLFVLSALKTYAQTQLKAQEEGAGIASQLEILSRIKANGQRAQAAIAANNAAQAQGIYQESISLLPELNTAHQALVNQAITAYQDQVLKETQDKIVRIEGIMTQAANAIGAGNYDVALRTYDEAMQVLPELASIGQNLSSGLIRLGYSVADLVVLNRNAQAFTAVVNRAQVSATKTLAALDNHIATAVKNRENELIKQLSDTGTQLAEVSAIYERRLAEEQGTLTARVASLETTTKDLTTQRDTLQTQATALQTEINRLTRFEQLLSVVTQQYQTYRTKESQALGQNTGTSLSKALAARQELENFIGSRELSGIFPGFSANFRASDAALQNAGRDLGLSEALEILDGVFSQATQAQKQRYIDNEIAAARSAGDTTQLTFLEELAQIVQ